jgi:23S rRNA (uracil1939-C5)-methyltransferase
MKRGDSVVVVIEELSPQGDGIGRVGERRIAVPRSVPGDRVEVAIKGKRKGRLEGRAEQFLEHGFPRQPAPCLHFGECGGCRWQDLEYAVQLELKERMVRGALQGPGARTAPLLPILASPKSLRYRNKMEFSFGLGRGGQLQLGLHVRERFNRLFDVEECHLLSARASRIVQAARQHARLMGLPAYDLQTHQGVLRFLVVREAGEGAQVLVNLVVAEYPRPEVDELVGLILQDVPQIDTFIVALHQGKAQVAIGQREFLLKGSGRIFEECGGLVFEVSSRSFFQTNPQQAERLYQVVGELAGSLVGASVLDLYCGTGGTTLHLARSAESVLGVELVEEAVADARRNAERNGIRNCRFVAGPAEDVLGQIHRSGQRFDLVVADPPRAGLHQRALAALAALGPPVILYVSCNPFTLAPDLEALSASGYRVELVQPVDMFPQTPHCEAVARLVRQSPTV